MDILLKKLSKMKKVIEKTHLSFLYQKIKQI